MSRREAARLADIHAAIDAIERHLSSHALDDEIAFDAVRMRLIEIGEAVKDLGEESKNQEPSIPWRQIAGMRDRLTHRYFENEVEIVRDTVRHDLPALAAAVERLSKI